MLALSSKLREEKIHEAVFLKVLPKLYSWINISKFSVNHIGDRFNKSPL